MVCSIGVIVAWNNEQMSAPNNSVKIMHVPFNLGSVFVVLFMLEVAKGCIILL